MSDLGPPRIREKTFVSTPGSRRLHRYTLATLALGITVLFLWMIQEFLTALLLAALLSGLFHPLYSKLKRPFGGRRRLAAAATVAIVALSVLVPLAGFFTIVAAQAVHLARSARPWVEEQLRGGQLSEAFLRTRVGQMLEPYREWLLERLAGIASSAGAWVATGLSAVAQSTLSFAFMLFVMLYAQFFFLKDGKAMLYKILYYLPLPAEDENRMLEKFVSVTRATIKGTLVIGIIQGALGGLALAVIGVDGAAVWGTIMAVLSVVPGLGPALVWVPVVAYLALVGRYPEAIGLFAWCAAIVGTVDNLLRPRLVGRDTKMSDLMVLLSTLGGIVLFGAAGIIIGPIVAALFVTVWDLYGTAFHDVLPKPDIAQSVLPGPHVPVHPWAKKSKRRTSSVPPPKSGTPSSGQDDTAGPA